MAASDLAALLVAITCLAAIAVLVVAVISLVRTLRALREVVDVLREETIPMLAEIRSVVDRATEGLDRVDHLLDAAEDISGTVDAASRLTYRALAPPLVGAASVSAGIGRFLRRLRGETTSGSLTEPGRSGNVIEAATVDRRRRRRAGGNA
ncbi:MAG TPA: hypothetical protein DGF10_06970 [Acidimicrobiaceae bacterium]|nr:hypothetical protein [Acidimicrobiaceae bacterium]HAQ23532.1 hypothetical protein [Acidimicrobiaceae bacterium]HCV34394.1 hypothetical protein [Acidimicrobiaceae bacterium]|tara:strand:- start:3069 stop:3521 length:453 start_codon:yes stop_codon:yes gene_type:complete